MWRLISPVFVYECVLGARRWQMYAARMAVLLALLITLGATWALRFSHYGFELTRNQLSVIGESFFNAIIGTQLVLALVAAPAYLAASICLDKARGTLTHMLVTDLRSSEIVLGKLGAHGLPVLGLLLAGLPVLVLATLLGGIEPGAVIGDFLVTVSAAILCCSIALVLSVWARKPYEVLLATYIVEFVWLLAWPMWTELRRDLGPPPDLLRETNPFALLFAVHTWSASEAFAAYAQFVGLCLGISTVLIFLAVRTLRRASQPSQARSRRRLPRLKLWQPAIDMNPMLWRDWRRRPSSRWLHVVWWVYALACLGASLLTFGDRTELGPFVNAFQFSIGLLLVTVTAVASLFDERVNGSLEVILTTPLSTPSIVWGKWLASFRGVLLVSLLPLLVSLWAVAAQFTGARAYRSDLIFVQIPLMLAYGALATSLALALATWVPRFGAAVGLAVAAYVLLAAGPVLVLIAVGPGSYESLRGFVCASPWYGIGETTAQITHASPHENVGWKLFWMATESAAALALVVSTLGTFDRCLGRVDAGRGCAGSPPVKGLRDADTSGARIGDMEDQRR